MLTAMSIIKSSFALWCGRQIAFSVTVRTLNYFMYCKDIFENLLAEFNYTFAAPGMQQQQQCSENQHLRALMCRPADNGLFGLTSVTTKIRITFSEDGSFIQEPMVPKFEA